jgi:hypothetical protein
MQIDESDEQPENVESLIPEGLAPDSNVTLASLKQPLKQEAPRTPTERGMQIDESDEQPANREPPARKRLEGDSNVTVASFEHPSKQ